MRAVVLTEDRPHLKVTTVADPTPKPDEVLLRVTGCGICGSDLHIASQIAPIGMILGHEIVGAIEDHGASVDRARWPRGRTVAARPLTGCGNCVFCARGRSDHCAQFSLQGLDRPGGFAELTTIPASELFAIPTTVTGTIQALIEPLAVAHRAISRARLTATDSILVLGAGPIGLAVIAWAHQLGIHAITVSDPTPQRRTLAERLGATTTFDPFAAEFHAAVADLHPMGPTVVFECSGRPGLIQQASTFAAVNARVVVVGVCLAQDTFAPFVALSKELDVRYSMYYERSDFIATLDALENQSLDAVAMITDVVNLDNLPERFERLNRDTDGGKVILAP